MPFALLTRRRKAVKSLNYMGLILIAPCAGLFRNIIVWGYEG